ncbi:hypothetical protein ANOM_011005 [Aspergillus nomiae NRRL 13137]|uniref:Xylanolytic transcriptional activator regulatory domain-containing protein n=1 Tax=Aspergillus nomiae NRRL (strain ATCC 15546 / NRRL 13137 / CBS 260.88 / M93) TaxID=1509407 RepID=A0A0L1IM75_ASPN3|nr:uncharacterized protein ANOM_011005 [Aspergillus nomiae NRRL 13137]KNG80716.1 hypothetical protein ANOM_011005 [Aspergillus nomiae NRRL 13137]
MATFRWDFTSNVEHRKPHPPHRPKAMGRKPQACVPCHERKRWDADMNFRKPKNTHGQVPTQRQQSKAAEGDLRSHAFNSTPSINHANGSITNHATLGADQSDGRPPTLVPTRPPEMSFTTQTNLPPLQEPLPHRSPSSGVSAREEQSAELPNEQQMRDDSPDLARLNGSSQVEEGEADYHEGISSIYILSEALGCSTSNNLAERILRESPGGVSELDDVDSAYLRHKGVYNIPVSAVCDQLIRLFFDRVYAYAPVFDRVRFTRDYRQQKPSLFLLHAILASAIPHASIELLHDAGFDDHITAQRCFFTRAKLLHDVGGEKSQVRILQGSLFLAMSPVSRDMEKDHRYWISNAARIAIRLGLHRSRTASNFDPDSRKIYRRIWWVVYSWDTLLALHGLEAVRSFQHGEFDTPTLTKDDWGEENISPDIEDLLRPIPELHKSFLIESCKLQFGVGRFWKDFISSESGSAVEQIRDFMASWRRSLQEGLKVSDVQDWNESNFWALYLNTRCYVCECVIYRMLRSHLRPSKNALYQLADKNLTSAMFELDVMLGRISANRMAQYCPWYTCACTALALHIEKAVTTPVSTHEKYLNIFRIHSELEFLRELSKMSSLNKSSLQMFEKIIRTTGLCISMSEASTPSGQELESEFVFNPPSETPRRYALQTTQGLCTGDSEFALGLNIPDFELPFDFQFGPLGLMIWSTT